MRNCSKGRDGIFDITEVFVDDPYAIDYVPEEIETDDHDSESEEEMERADEEDVETECGHFTFFIGRRRNVVSQ